MIRELMNRDVVTCDSSAKVFDVAHLMHARDVGCVVVTHNQKPLGVLTDRDITLKCVAEGHDPKQTLASTILNKDLVTCHETDSFNACIQKMKSAQIRRLPVLDAQGKVVGVISFGDLVSILGQELYDLSNRSHWSKKAATAKKIA